LEEEEVREQVGFPQAGPEQEQAQVRAQTEPAPAQGGLQLGLQTVQEMTKGLGQGLAVQPEAGWTGQQQAAGRPVVADQRFCCTQRTATLSRAMSLPEEAYYES
jgi:hypothetical protein